MHANTQGNPCLASAYWGDSGENRGTSSAPRTTLQPSPGPILLIPQGLKQYSFRVGKMPCLHSPSLSILICTRCNNRESLEKA